MNELLKLLRDGKNHAFAVRHITKGGFDMVILRSKAQILRSPYDPDVLEIIVQHLSSCACKPMPKLVRR